MTTASILALDLSLTSTGYADSTGATGLIQPPKGVIGVKRLSWIRDTIMERVFEMAANGLVVIEGFSFGSRDAYAHALGEVGGVVRLAICDAGILHVDVPPASLKMFATGKGNAKKEVVYGEAIRKLGYAGNSHDVADALWLLKMAETHYTNSASNETQRKALAKIQWPSLPFLASLPLLEMVDA